MNYVLILINYFPEYIFYVLNSILSVDKDATVYIAHNDIKKINYKNIVEINLNEIESEYLKRFNELDVFKNTIFENNPLWITSVQRIFYLDQIIKDLNLSNTVHFDNDILIYKPFAEIESTINKDTINITSYNSKKLIFGYSYFQNGKLSDYLSKEILKEYENGIDNNWINNNEKPLNEMEIMKLVELKNPNIFNLLPSLPFQNQILFDPAGYGQYIDGTHTNPKKLFKRGYTSIYDPVGVEILAKRVKVQFNKKPFVLWEGNKFNLSNLHVHSKRFKKLLPAEYKAYIN